MSEIAKSLDESVQESLLSQIKDYEKKVKNLERKVHRLERDRDAIGEMYERAVRLQGDTAREKEDQYRYNQLILDTLPSVLILFDTKLRYVIGTRDLIGRRFGKARTFDPSACSLSELFGPALSKEWISKTENNLRQCIDAPSSMFYHDTIQKDGTETMHVNVTITPAPNKDGEVFGVMLLLYDVTELMHLKETAGKNSDTRNGFLANMSHEIRTPTNAILGMASLLEATPLGEAQSGYVKNIKDASDSLLCIVSDILDYSRIGAGQMVLSVDTYVPADLIKDVATQLCLRAYEKGLDFYIYMAPDIPCRLVGDEMRIRQVLEGLLSNAVKYTKTGTVSLSVYTQRISADTVTLCCSVQDTGIGIKKEARKYLFVPFSRPDIKKHIGIQGTGLGLAVSKGIVDAMDGTITVTSAYGKGSTFTFRIPQRVSDDTPMIRPTRPGNLRVLIAGAPAGCNELAGKLRVLKIPYMQTSDTGEFLQLLAGDVFTHLIYWDGFLSARMRRAAEAAHALTRICVKRYTDSPEGSNGASVLFEPLLITEVAAKLAADPGDPSEHAQETQQTPGALASDRVLALVVDDNKVNRTVVGEILKQYDIEVKLAASGEAALGLIRDHTFDIVFMDHVMPGMDGIETTRVIRESGGRNAEVPIVALTANAIVGTRDLFLSNEMDDYLSKPIEIRLLNEILMKWLPQDKLRSKKTQQPVVMK